MKELVKVFKNANGEIVTDSLKIAEDFGKAHKRVLQDVREKLTGTDFAPVKSSYVGGNGEERIKYELDKNCFMLLVMNYQGNLELKKQYIKEYSDMERFIQESNLSEEFKYYRQTGKIARRELTDTIKYVLHPSNQHVYGNYTNLIYKRLFNMNTKQLKDSKGLSKSDNLRDFLTPDELGQVLKLEKRVDAYIVTLHDMDLENKEVYNKIKNLINK